jgi:hypothetical protein
MIRPARIEHDRFIRLMILKSSRDVIIVSRDTNHAGFQGYVFSIPWADAQGHLC